MAKLGLKYPVTALAAETGSSISYSSGAVLAKAISAKVKINTNDTKLYADDGVCESDHSFSDGTISIEIDELSNVAKIALLGNTEGSTVDSSLSSKEVKASGADVPAYVGLGFYGKKIVAGAVRWRAIWLKKIQFSEPDDDMTTKKDKTEFGTTTLEGTILVAADGYWKEEGTFDTEAEAVAYLNGKAGISSTASNNITALAFSGGTLTPTFAAGTYNYSCALTTTSTQVTATFAAGTARVYVDGVYNQTLTTATASTSISIGTSVSKLLVITVQESGKAAVTYNIMVQKS